MSAPYIPHLTKPSGKDTVFLTLAGSRSSTPDDFYAPCRRMLERGGDFSAAGSPPIYDPVTGQQFTLATPNPQRVRGPVDFASGHGALQLFPSRTSHRPLVIRTTTICSPPGNRIPHRPAYVITAVWAPMPRSPGDVGARRRGTRRRELKSGVSPEHQPQLQLVAFGFRPGESRSRARRQERVRLLFGAGGLHGGISPRDQHLQRSAGIAATVTRRISSPILRMIPLGEFGHQQCPTMFLSTTDIPDISLSNFQGISQKQPSFSISQTIAFTEVVSWIHGKHNMRYGGDYRRVHRDFLAGSNATGSFTFSGLFTEDAAQDPRHWLCICRFPARPAAVDIAQFLAYQELPSRQRLSTPTPWTIGVCPLAHRQLRRPL